MSRRVAGRGAIAPASGALLAAVLVLGCGSAPAAMTGLPAPLSSANPQVTGTAPIGRMAGASPVPAAPGETAGPVGAPSASSGLRPEARSLASRPAVARYAVTSAFTALVLPHPLSRAVALGLDGVVFVYGGLTATGTTATILRLDPASGITGAPGRLAVGVHDAAGVVLDGSALIIGGGQVSQDSTVQRVTTSGRAAVVGHLPVPRADLAAVVVGGSVIVVGGGAAGGADARVLATSDGVRFHTIAALKVAVRYAAVAPLAGRVYVFGGTSPTGDVAAIQEVDPATGRTRIMGKLAQTLSHATAFVLGSTIYIAGGRHGGRSVATILRFDPASGTAVNVGRLPQSMSDSAAVVLGKTAYLVGGEAARVLTSVVSIKLG